MKIAIIRKPCLMEDEGRHFLMQVIEGLDSRAVYAEARKWLSEQEGAYFGPSDYYIAHPGSKEVQ